jgi:CopG family nickel-responsive transcriptional regulator
MPIISISLNDNILEEMANSQSTLGFSGRSELIRAAVRMFINEMKTQNEFTGKINGVLITSHSQDIEHFVTNIKHKYEDIINTQLHSRLEEGKCLEVFILEGAAERVKQMLKSLQTHKKIDYVKLMRA